MKKKTKVTIAKEDPLGELTPIQRDIIDAGARKPGEKQLEALAEFDQFVLSPTIVANLKEMGLTPDAFVAEIQESAKKQLNQLKRKKGKKNK